MSRHLHPADKNFFRRIESIAFRLAAINSLTLRRFSPLPKRQTEKAYGICYTTSKHVQLAVRSVDKMGRWLPYRNPSWMIATFLCHELAHLRYPHHGAKFIGLKGKLIFDLYRCNWALQISNLTRQAD